MIWVVEWIDFGMVCREPEGDEETDSGVKVFFGEFKAWKMGIIRPVRLCRIRKIFSVGPYNL